MAPKAKTRSPSKRQIEKYRREERDIIRGLARKQGIDPKKKKGIRQKPDDRVTLKIIKRFVPAGEEPVRINEKADGNGGFIVTRTPNFSTSNVIAAENIRLFMNSNHSELDDEERAEIQRRLSKACVASRAVFPATCVPDILGGLAKEFFNLLDDKVEGKKQRRIRVKHARAFYQWLYYRLNDERAKSYQSDYNKTHKKKSGRGRKSGGSPQPGFEGERETIRRDWNAYSLAGVTPIEKFAKVVNGILQYNHIRIGPVRYHLTLDIGKPSSDPHSHWKFASQFVRRRFDRSSRAIIVPSPGKQEFLKKEKEDKKDEKKRVTVEY